MTLSVDRFFDSLTSDYTATILRCFPDYQEMLWALLSYLPEDVAPRSVLDLGSGTGNLSVVARRAFPDASLACVDVSVESLEICEKRLGELPGAGKCSFHASDFRDVKFEAGSFDLVISCIAVHHVPSDAKRQLFQSIEQWLRPGGTLAMADQFRGVTDEIYSRHIALWREASLAAGGTEEEFEMWMEHQREHDHHDTSSDQMGWLSESGLAGVDCVWRKLLWAVLLARKPADAP